MGKTGEKLLYPITTPQNADYVHAFSEAIQENVSFLVSDIVGGGASVQDNKRLLIQSQSTEEGGVIHDVINATDFSASLQGNTYFTVQDVNLVIFKVPFKGQSGGTIKFYYKYYLLLNYGKGDYGVGGNITLEAQDLLFFKTSEVATVPTDPNGDPAIVYTFKSSDLSAPHTAINIGTAGGGYPVTNDGDYYVELVTAGSDIPGSGGRSLWKFTEDAATNPIFGVNGDGSVAAFTDFTLFDLDESTNFKEDKILVKKTIVGAVIGGTDIVGDDIHLAVNRSFRGQIIIGNNEIRIFEVQRKVVASDKSVFSMWLEKYAYTQGEAVIVSDSVREDYELVYERKLTQDIGIINSGNNPAVIALGWHNLDDPAAAINASSDTYVIDATKDWVFIIYDNTDATSDLYKMYAFSTDAGDYGTYGDDGNQDLADNSQLTLITQETGSSTNPVQYFEEFTPDSYLGKRLRIILKHNISGFYIKRNANERVGIDIVNTSVGTSAVANIAVRTTDDHYGDEIIQLSMYGANYFNALLKGTGGLFSRKEINFAQLKNVEFHHYFSPDNNMANLTRKFSRYPDGTQELMGSSAQVGARGDKSAVNIEYLNSRFDALSEANTIELMITFRATVIPLTNITGYFIVGKTYFTSQEIDSPNDFVNVGFVAPGVPFVAAAAVPTNWTSSANSFVCADDYPVQVEVINDNIGLSWNFYYDEEGDLIGKLQGVDNFISFLAPISKGSDKVFMLNGVTMRVISGGKGLNALPIKLAAIGPQHNWQFEGYGSLTTKSALATALGILEANVIVLQELNNILYAGIDVDLDPVAISVAGFTHARGVGAGEGISNIGLSFPTEAFNGNTTIVELSNNSPNIFSGDITFGNDVFSNVTTLKKIKNVFTTIITMGTGVFNGCTGLSESLINNALIEVPAETFRNTGIPLPDLRNVELIKQSAFRENTMYIADLENMMGRVIEIEANGFSNMPNLEKFVAETSTTTYGNEVFKDDVNLVDIDMFAATSLGTDVFLNLPNGGTLRIPAALNADANVVYLAGKGWTIVNV